MSYLVAFAHIPERRRCPNPVSGCVASRVNQTRTARLLGVDPKTVYRKLRRYGNDAEPS